jgi:hypothetical protein
MGKPPGHDDTRDPAESSAAAHGDDPDRAAILARRQRFIALALSGLASATACEKPKADPSTPKDVKATQEGKDDKGAPPQPCLNVQRVEPEAESAGKPMPCLDVAPPEPEPDDGSPHACLKIAAPPTEPEPKPQPCLKIAPPEPEPKPQPCLKVRQPEPEPKPQPCLRVAKPEGA